MSIISLPHPRLDTDALLHDLAVGNRLRELVETCSIFLLGGVPRSIPLDSPRNHIWKLSRTSDMV